MVPIQRNVEPDVQLEIKKKECDAPGQEHQELQHSVCLKEAQKNVRILKQCS